jgi:hypothetical protein
MANVASMFGPFSRRAALGAAFDPIDAASDGAELDATDATARLDASDATTDAASAMDATDARERSDANDVNVDRDARSEASADSQVPDASITRSAACSASGTIACLDFERDPPAEWSRLTSRAASLAFDTTRAFRGRAMHASVPRTTDTVLALLQLMVSSDRIAAGLYVSAWVRAENVGSTTAFPVLEINNAQRASMTVPFAKLSLDHLGVPAPEGQLALATTGRYLTGAGFPRGQWLCARLFIASDGVGGMRASVHADAQTIAVTHNIDPRGFDTPQVGLVGIGDPGELWIDDVYVGNRDVGCLSAR